MAPTSTLNPEFIVKDERDLRSSYSETHAMAVKKCLDHIDPHARAFIERSPFLCVGTQSKNGSADVSPRGDSSGFVKILDERTLLIPDRPGNNRLDTLSNILANPAVGLLFMIPGFDETLRVNGTAKITRDPNLLSFMTVNNRPPTMAIVVHLQEVFVHCAKAFRRSSLWDPSQHQDRKEFPSLMKIILDQTTGAPKDASALAKLDEDLEQEYRDTMY